MITIGVRLGKGRQYRNDRIHCIYLECCVFEREWFQCTPTLLVLLEHGAKRLLWGQLQQQAHVGGCPHAAQFSEKGVIECGKEGDLLSYLPVGVEQVPRVFGEREELRDTVVFHVVHLLEKDFDSYVLAGTAMLDSEICITFGLHVYMYMYNILHPILQLHKC